VRFGVAVILGAVFWCVGIAGMFVYVGRMQRFICAYVVYQYAICLEKDILYMCKTEIQLKKDIKMEVNEMKKVFTTNWYLQRSYFQPIVDKQKNKC
jgi:hypothetical protein